MIKKVNNVSITHMPKFCSSYPKWNTVGNKYKFSYIYIEKKG